ncbi:hypothetical protein [Variovorax saccharolyticus]|uniref:hypothetical protein n=1 Tax=Variovorax saccharolyticus TaxID=3053516 RepID=UPI00336ABD5A
MPGTTGIELLDMGSARDWNLPVVFLTGQGDMPTCAASLRRCARLPAQAGR